jgi:hypothetical protein
MVFHGVEYWNEENLIHNFKLWDASKNTIHDFLQIEAELMLDWTKRHGRQTPLRMLVDVSEVGLIPSELFLTYKHPQLRSVRQMPLRYIAYLSDHITHQLLFHRVAQAGGADWQQYRRLVAPHEAVTARRWLHTVYRHAELEYLPASR